MAGEACRLYLRSTLSPSRGTLSQKHHSQPQKESTSMSQNIIAFVASQLYLNLTPSMDFKCKSE